MATIKDRAKKLTLEEQNAVRNQVKNNPGILKERGVTEDPLQKSLNNSYRKGIFKISSGLKTANSAANRSVSDVTGGKKKEEFSLNSGNSQIDKVASDKTEKFNKDIKNTGDVIENIGDTRSIVTDNIIDQVNPDDVKNKTGIQLGKQAEDISFAKGGDIDEKVNQPYEEVKNNLLDDYKLGRDEYDQAIDQYTVDVANTLTDMEVGMNRNVNSALGISALSGGNNTAINSNIDTIRNDSDTLLQRLRDKSDVQISNLQQQRKNLGTQYDRNLKNIVTKQKEAINYAKTQVLLQVQQLDIETEVGLDALKGIYAQFNSDMLTLSEKTLDFTKKEINNINSELNLLERIEDYSYIQNNKNYQSFSQPASLGGQTANSILDFVDNYITDPEQIQVEVDRLVGASVNNTVAGIEQALESAGIVGYGHENAERIRNAIMDGKTGHEIGQEILSEVYSDSGKLEELRGRSMSESDRLSLDGQRQGIESNKLSNDTKRITNSGLEYEVNQQLNPTSEQTGDWLSFPDGYDCGVECGQYARTTAGMVATPGGNDKEARVKAFSDTEGVPGGMIFFNGDEYDSTYGHISLIESVNEDGGLNVVESNLKGENKISRRTIDPNDPNISGFYNKTPLAESNKPVDGFDLFDAPLYKAFNSDKGLTSAEQKAIPNYEEFKQKALNYGNEIAAKGTPLIKQLIQTAERLKLGDGQMRALAVTGGIPFGKSRDYKADFDTFISANTLNQLIDLKAQGATFGALSEKELETVSNMATNLKLTTSQSAYEAELDRIIGILESGLSDETKENIRKKYPEDTGNTPATIGVATPKGAYSIGEKTLFGGVSETDYLINNY